MTKKTDGKFQYIPKLRYIVEIKDEKTGKIIYSKRICFKDNARVIKDNFNMLKDYAARVFDTKTGDIF